LIGCELRLSRTLFQAGTAGGEHISAAAPIRIQIQQAHSMLIGVIFSAMFALLSRDLPPARLIL